MTGPRRKDPWCRIGIPNDLCRIPEGDVRLCQFHVCLCLCVCVCERERERERERETESVCMSVSVL